MRADLQRGILRCESLRVILCHSFRSCTPFPDSLIVPGCAFTYQSNVMRWRMMFLMYARSCWNLIKDPDSHKYQQLCYAMFRSLQQEKACPVRQHPPTIRQRQPTIMPPKRCHLLKRPPIHPPTLLPGSPNNLITMTLPPNLRLRRSNRVLSNPNRSKAALATSDEAHTSTSKVDL